MKVLDFIRNNNDWRVLLKKDYKINIQEEEPYILLKYSNKADFHDEIVKECRGLILKKIYANGKIDYQVVCYPFQKFFNFGEYGTLDFFKNENELYSVTAKIDGSLMKLFFDDGKWHLSTNGRIDAFKTPAFRNVTFGDAFVEALGKYGFTYSDFLSKLLKNETYLFELVTPYNCLTVDYNDKYYIYYLASYDNFTFSELNERSYLCNFIDVPSIFFTKDVDEILEYVKSLPKNNEGVVVQRISDKQRVKIKTEWFVKAFYYHNGVFSKKTILETILNNETSEFLVYFPKYKDLIGYYLNLLREIEKKAELYAHMRWNNHLYLNKDVTDKEYAIYVNKNFPSLFRDFIIKNKSKIISWKEYTSNWDINNWNNFIKKYIKEFEKDE